MDKTPRMEAAAWGASVHLLRSATNLDEGIRDLRQGRDGWLYLLTDARHGKLIRVLRRQRGSDRSRRWAALTALGMLSLGLAACGGSGDDDQPQQVVQVAGANAADLQTTIDGFRARLGANNGVAAATTGGRREVNWDGIPAASLDPFPGNFFSATSPRGIVFSTPGSRMKVNGDPGSASFLFADVTARLPNGQPWGPIEFGTFSPSRFFATMDSNITDVSFTVPGSSTPATVSAFGAVLVDVDVAEATRLEFYDRDGLLIYRHGVPVAGAPSKGLSFVGVQLSRPAARVRIIAGTHPVNAPFQDPPPDGVGIDDVIVAEPLAR